MKVVYGETVRETRKAVAKRLTEIGLPNASGRKVALEILRAGQVVATVTKGNLAHCAVGFKRMSSVGKIFQKLCRPMSKLESDKS